MPDKNWRKILAAKRISRHNFLKLAACGAAGWILQTRLLKFVSAFAAAESSPGRIKRQIPTLCDLSVAKGDNAYEITQKAVAALGGIERFVKPGSTVLIKPNIAWDRTPEQAANTNPEVVAALIDLCWKASARRVNVFDISCNDPRRCYLNSGIQQIAQAHKANIFHPQEWNTLAANFAYKSGMQNWRIQREALECDCFINVPIAKHHGLTGLTLSMKNLMGVCAGNRGQMHFNIAENLVDLTDFINPELTVIDAVRVLTSHGPQGGRLEDVRRLDTVVAGTDPVLCDTYACELMQVSPQTVSYLTAAQKRGFGNPDIKQAKIIQAA